MRFVTLAVVYTQTSLVPMPPLVLRFAFSITQTEEQKTGEAWERSCTQAKSEHTQA